MKKLILSLLLFIPLITIGQTVYDLRYPTINMGTGSSSNVNVRGKINVAGMVEGNIADSLLVVKNGQIKRVPAYGNAGLTTYFFYKTNSDISTYYQMKFNASTGPLQTISATSVASDQLLVSFATNTGIPNITFLPSGIISVYISASQTSGSVVTTLYGKLFKRDTSGTETLISTTANSVALTNTQNSLLFQSALANGIILDATDRLVIKIYAFHNGSGSLPNITLDIENNTASRLELPSTAVDATNFVPYTGAVKNVELGTYKLIADSVEANIGNFSNGIIAEGVTINNGGGNEPTNIAIGANSLLNGGSSSFDNIGVGVDALRQNTNGASNIALGNGALQTATSPVSNIAIGSYTLYDNKIGQNNTVIGVNALVQNRGSNNTTLGYQTGAENINGSGNVFLGYQAGFNETGSNKLYISNSNTTTPLIKGDFAANTLTVKGRLYADSLIKIGGLSSQFLKADGGVDGTAYQPLLTNPITGLGTGNPVDGYLARFNASLTITNSNIYDNGTNIGIGTNNPLEKLDVNGIIKSNNRIFTNKIGVTSTTSGFYIGTTTTDGISIGDNGVTSYKSIQSHGGILSINPSGQNVAVGGIVPQYKFEVFGTIGATERIIASNIGTSATTSGFFVGSVGSTDGIAIGSNGINSFKSIQSFGGNLALNPTSGNVGIGTSSPAVKLQVIGDIATSTRLVADTINGYTGGSTPITIQTGGAQDVVIGTNTTERLRITSGGNVGIGLTNPETKLHIENSSDLMMKLSRAGVGAWGLNVNSSGDFFLINRFNTNVFTIKDGGNVGIGTSSPSNLLQVYGSQNSYLANFTGSSGGSSARGLTIGTYVSNGGNDCGVEFNAAINNTGFGSFKFSAGSAEFMRITSGGDVLIGRTTTTFQNPGIVLFASGSAYFEKVGAIFDLNRIGSDGILQAFYRSGAYVGNISVTSTSASFNSVSDYRLKQDLKDYNGLSLISRIKTYDYEWKSVKERMYGVMAHELQEVIPYAVTGEKDGEQMQGVDYSKLVPILVKAIQQQQAQIEELKAKVKQLENK